MSNKHARHREGISRKLDRILEVLADLKKVAQPVAQPEPPSRNASPAAGVDLVIHHYQTHHPRAKPGDKERKLIAARLKEDWTLDDLCRAIDGCHKSPHHCGDNDQGKKYQDLALILRDSSQVQTFVEIAAGEGLVERTGRNGSADRNSAARFFK